MSRYWRIIGVWPPAAPAVACRLATAGADEVEERVEQVGPGGDDVTAVEEALAAVDVGDEAAGLAHKQRAGGHVPPGETHLPVAVEAAGCDMGEVHGSGAGPAHAAAAGQGSAKGAHPRIEQVEPSRRQPGAEQGVIELARR